MFLRSLVVLLSSVVFAGCASTTIAPDTSSSIQQGRIATAAYTVEKRILYEELVYKVLYNETRSQQAVFDDFWDIDRAHGERLTSALDKLELSATPASTALSEETYAQFEQTIRQSQESAKRDKPEPFKLEEITRSSLMEAGYDYLVLLRTAHIFVNTTSLMDSATIMVPSVLIVLDLEANREEYNEYFLLQGFVEYEESVRELEDNNLALIKEATQQRLEEGLEKRLADILAIADTN